MMYSIITSPVHHPHLVQLRAWAADEWGHIDPFDQVKGRVLPAPLLAVSTDARENLLGGLAFTWYAAPGSEQLALWVNLLFVKPEARGTGIGTALIHAAVQHAKAFGAAALYAYTDVPEIYLKAGWHCIEATDTHKVLQAEL